jgi:ComF family protein
VPWTYHLNQWFWGSLDLLFPPACGGCDRAGYRWCPDCQKRVQIVPEPVCQVCGLPLAHPGLCPACSHSRPPYALMRSWLVFEGPIRLALHKLKYRGNISLGDALARQLAPHARTLDWPIDIVVPIPLGRKRMQERGYNQVGLVAKPLAVLNGWEYAPRALVRARETRSQVGLSAAERKENVSGAFRGNPTLVSGKTVLLIDDVATTGATLSSGADALFEAGARDVYAYTLARALPQHGLKIV